MTIAIVDVTTSNAGVLKCHVIGFTKTAILARHNGARLSFGYDGVCKTQSVVWQDSKIDPAQLAEIEFPVDRKTSQRLPLVTIDDCTLSVSGWCKRLGVAHRYVCDDIKAGMKPEDAIRLRMNRAAKREAPERTEAARDKELWHCVSCPWINGRRFCGSDGTFKICPKCGARVKKA